MRGYRRELVFLAQFLEFHRREALAFGSALGLMGAYPGVLRASDVSLEIAVFQMDLRDEIVARVETLPSEMQERVLQFVASLAAPPTKGESGSVLRRFSGSLDPVSAQEMVRAIEEECERVDASEW